MVIFLRRGALIRLNVLACSCLSHDYAVMMSRIAFAMRNSVFNTRLQRLVTCFECK